MKMYVVTIEFCDYVFAETEEQAIDDFIDTLKYKDHKDLIKYVAVENSEGI